MRVLTVVCSVVALAVGAHANLLLNPGFENGSGEEATGWWRYELAGRQSWGARSGSYHHTWYGWVNDWYGGFGQDVTQNVSIGDVVQFSIWGNSETGFVSSIQEAIIKLEFWSGGTLSYAVTNNVYSDLVNNRNTWIKLGITHTNTASAITMIKPVIGFGHALGYGTSAVKWDDANLDVIPEPTVVGLLGIRTALATLCRRRVRK